jgi:primase-polymerase (primpol)-like protein
MKNYENVPPLLKELHQWTMWKFQKKKNGGLTKVPCDKNGTPHSVVKSANWLSFEESQRLAERGGFDWI